MGKAGPAKIPTALKLAHNMASVTNLNRAEPQVQAMRSAPPPPQNLTDFAAEEWDRVATIMVDVGMLTELDLATLACYCESFRTWRQACDIMRELEKVDPVSKGLIVRSPGGAAYMNPVQAVKQAAARDMLKFAAQLGLTPSSRASISVGERGGIGKPNAPARTDLAKKYNL